MAFAIGPVDASLAIEAPMVGPFRAFPSGDLEFGRAVGEAAFRADTADRLRELIRLVYPRADVVVQDPEGALANEPLRIYVYRDGSVARRDGE
jgi:hypothetical protein